MDKLEFSTPVPLPSTNGKRKGSMESSIEAAASKGLLLEHMKAAANEGSFDV